MTNLQNDLGHISHCVKICLEGKDDLFFRKKLKQQEQQQKPLYSFTVSLKSMEWKSSNIKDSSFWIVDFRAFPPLFKVLSGKPFISRATAGLQRAKVVKGEHVPPLLGRGSRGVSSMLLLWKGDSPVCVILSLCLQGPSPGLLCLGGSIIHSHTVAEPPLWPVHPAVHWDLEQFSQYSAWLLAGDKDSGHSPTLSTGRQDFPCSYSKSS